MKRILHAAILALSVFSPLAASAGNLVEFGTPYNEGKPVQILGYLARPDILGRSPAVVMLHGCTGFFPFYVMWAERLKSWGYVALAVDSLGPRHLPPCGTAGMSVQPLDGYAALDFLAQQPFVDPDRVAVMGFSMGGGSALADVERGWLQPLSKRSFRAAVAYYPICAGKSGVMTAPTLILIGERDDWTTAQYCRDMMEKRRGKGADVKIVFYPDAYHAFNIDLPPRTEYGHHLEYDPLAAADAVEQVRWACWVKRD